MLQPPAMLDRDRHRKGREAVQEIRSAVQGIDDPDVLVIAAAAGLLGENRVIRVTAVNRGNDVRLGLAVDVGDEVVAALGVDFDGIEARQAAHNDIAGAAGRAYSNIEERLHKGR